MSPFEVIGIIYKWGQVYVVFAPWGWWFVFLYSTLTTYLLTDNI